MSVIKAICPSCGGPVEFTAGSTIVVVCPFCRSAVARTDRALEDLGKVAEISQSESPLKLGLKGAYQGSAFELTGRAQFRHQLGGVWDEWYASFSNGWVAWLAEAQGKFYLTFYQPMPEGRTLPAYEHLEIGGLVTEVPGDHKFIVAEKGIATAVAAEGEIPYRFIPGEQDLYADLAGVDDAFATIDYGLQPPWLFIGKQVPLDQIGLERAAAVKREPRTTGAAAMSCPNCGGPLEVSVPDRSERVTCPSCDSLLSIDQGHLKYLRSLRTDNVLHNFVLPIGIEGTFPGDVKFKVIGAVVRSVTIEGETYFWHEYLLYNAHVGFRWLVHSDNHWNFVEPINIADVDTTSKFSSWTGAPRDVRYNGNSYRIFQDAQARVEYVRGEFYWAVSQGEQVRAIDYVNGGLMLSQEISGNEMTWSAGVYMTNADVEKAFNVSDLPKPWNIAPNQPFTGSFYYTWGLLPLVMLFIVGVFMIPLSGLTNTVFTQDVVLQPSANPGAPQTLFSQPFELKGNRNVRITARAPVSNSWAELDVDLVNDQSQEVESVNIPIEFYSGTDSDGSWSEGGQTQDATLSALPAGKYTLRVEGSWMDAQKPMPVSLKVEQNVNRGVNFCCALLLLLVMPAIALFRKISFESSKWKDSMFTATGSDDDSDDD